jgi:hypothetical protein
MQFFSTLETIRNAQQDFYALDLSLGLRTDEIPAPDTFVQRHDLTEAESDGTLYHVGSTYSPENETVYDGISRSGRRVVTFAPILKHKVFPLPEILDLVLEMGTWGMGTPVEIEFAVGMEVAPGLPKDFAFLQIRPLVLSREIEELRLPDIPPEDILCRSSHVLGNGSFRGIHDIVVVDIERFDRTRSKETAMQIAELNARLIGRRRPYVLIGVGRWGSMDPWLGVPVTWDQINGACAIVESGFRDFDVTPSQGSHFFQNITSFRVGYFTVSDMAHTGFIDWEWLRAQPAEAEFEHARHLHFEDPLTVRINGQSNLGIIMKPGKG